ncbi:MAG: hypothetical protein EAS51_01555 [Microbacteriaceae bacterium]|nr:MAG: hypothetical protein EAS51_01555 [Microbacteriaceae bacterium]
MPTVESCERAVRERHAPVRLGDRAVPGGGEHPVEAAGFAGEFAAPSLGDGVQRCVDRPAGAAAGLDRLAQNLVGEPIPPLRDRVRGLLASGLVETGRPAGSRPAASAHPRRGRREQPGVGHALEVVRGGGPRNPGRGDGAVARDGFAAGDDVFVEPACGGFREQPERRVVGAPRERGFDGAITLVGREPGEPYLRPMLSQEYLRGEADAEELAAKPAQWYAEQRIDLRAGAEATAINRDARTVTLADGDRLGYRWLVLATGSTPRRLPVPGADLEAGRGARHRGRRTGADRRGSHAAQRAIPGGQAGADGARAAGDVTPSERAQPALGTLGGGYGVRPPAARSMRSR